MAVLGNRSLAYEPFVQDETVGCPRWFRADDSGYRLRLVVGHGVMLRSPYLHLLEV